MDDIEDDLASLRTAPLDEAAIEESATQVRESYIEKAFESYFRKQYKEAMVLLRKVTLDDMASIGIFVNCAYDFWRSVNTLMALAPTNMTTSRVLIDDAFECDPEKDPGEDLVAVAAAKELERRNLMKARSGQRVYSTLRMNVAKEQLMMYETHKTVKSADILNRSLSTTFDGGESSLGMESMAEGSMTLFDKTDDQTEALETAKKAFTQLLGGSNRKMIQAFDYIRLSHIYITEGALSGALQICQLGQARGHLENSLVVIQMWSLLKRLNNKDREAEQCMQYLVSAVQLETRENIDNDPSKKSAQAGPITGFIMVQNSDLPLAYIYLFCASYLQRKHVLLLTQDRNNPNLRTNGSKERELCYNMLAEAYFVRYNLHTNNLKDLMAWFMDSDMFFEIAVYLENTAFPLLAEEALFESFMRSPLETLPLEYLISLMFKHKRGAKRYVYEVMKKAYAFNPWNMFVRAWVSDYEDYEKSKYKMYENKFQKRFEKERQLACLIQGHIRGYLLRVKRWPAIYWAAKKKKDEFVGKRHVADMAYIQVQKALLKDRVRRWKEYSKYLKELRRQSSIKMQTHIRRMLALNRCRKMYSRAMRANGLFLLMSQNYYDLQRTRAFRKWDAIWRQRVLDRSATTLVETLISNGYSKVFHAACDQILKIIRVRRKWSNRKYYHQIRIRYLVRQKRHARATIRFFLRAQIERAKEQKRKEILERRERNVEILQAKSTAYILPLMSKHWDMWREVLHEKRCVLARAMIRVWLPRRWAKIKARAVVRLKRVKNERHRAFEMQCLFRRIGRYLFFWQRDAAVRPIQRKLRMRFAWKKRKRLAFIHKRINEITRVKNTALKIWAIWRCRKYLFLIRREYHRAARKITLCFQQWLKWKHIKRASRRKPVAYNLLWMMHCKVLGRAFKKMASGVTGLHTLMVLGPLFLSRWRQVIRVGFWRWRRFMIQQHRMDGLISAATKRLEHYFWKGAGDSMAICKKKTYATDELGKKGMCKTAFIMSWEAPIPVHRPLEVIQNRSIQLLFQNTETRIKIRAFQTYVASYRYRKRILRNGEIGAGMLARDLVGPLKIYLFFRQRAVRCIQCAYRQHLAKLVLHRLVTMDRRQQEILLIYKGIPTHKVFQFLHTRSNAQFKSRWILQCFFRRMLALCKVYKRRCYLEWLKERVEIIRLNSRSRRAVVQKVWHKMQIYYVYCISGVHEGGMVNTIVSLSRRLSQNRLALNNNITPPLPGKDYSQSRSNDKRDSSSSGSSSSGNSFTHAPLSSTSIRSSSKQSMLIKASGGNQQQQQQQHQQPPTNRINPKSGKIRSRPHGAAYMRGNIEYGYSRTEEYKEAHGLSGNEEDVYGHNDQDRKHQDLQLSLSLHRLQQTGVFIYDSSSNAVAGKELVYILQAASIVFCQNVNTQALTSIYEHYRGAKLVLCGGGFSFHDATHFAHYLSRRRDSLSLHFSDVTGASFTAILSLLLCLGEPSKLASQTLQLLCASNRLPVPPLGCMTHLKELSIDTSSLGCMGLATLLANMRYNSTVEILIIKFTLRNDLLPACYAKCFRLMKSNNTLKELRIFGCILGRNEVKGLYDAVWGGLRGLVLLEYSSATDSETNSVSNDIIQLAKDRLYAGRGSLSVSVI